MKSSILVTGGAGFIGSNFVHYLFDNYKDTDIYVMDKLTYAGNMNNFSDRIKESPRFHFLEKDITDREEVSKVMEKVDKVVHIAAESHVANSLTHADHFVLSNVFGTMEMTRAVLPHMRAAKQGRIVIVSSIGGRIGSLAVSAYCATKFAQEGFGESLAQEVIPFGIYVSLVEPAIIKTERWGANRAVARGALNPRSPYHAWFRGSESLADQLVETSPTKPVDVAHAVYKALIARRPRLRYMVGRRANLVMILRRFLPGGLFERLCFGEAVRRVIKTGQRLAQ